MRIADEIFKRLIDVLAAIIGLLILAPFLAPVIFFVWRHDGHTPFFISTRVGIGGRDFRMIKLRSMVVSADDCGVSSTSNSDDRITPIGHFIRRYKLDELVQLWNVLMGDMSLVGPRPQVRSGVALYTELERGLLNVKPGITDFASIVFSDEGKILEKEPNPDEAYNALIRSPKSRLGLFYIENRSLKTDVLLVYYTFLNIISRSAALSKVSNLLQRLGCDNDLVRIARRIDPLKPSAPPGVEVIQIG